MKLSSNLDHYGSFHGHPDDPRTDDSPKRDPDDFEVPDELE